MQGGARALEIMLPYDSTDCIRFNGYDLSRIAAAPLQVMLKLFAFFHQPDLVEFRPVLPGQVNLPVGRIAGYSVQHIRVRGTE